MRLVHPAPAAAVIALSTALAAILASQAGEAALSARVLLTALSVTGSQIVTGALNDWADRERDAMAQPSKPMPSGIVTERAALALGAAGLALQVAASAALGVLPLVIGLAAVASALAYDFWLSRTPASFVPYLVSFGLLPVWIAAGVGVPLERVAPAAVLIGPYAVAAHLANALRDFEGDAAVGSRNVAQRLGRRRSLVVAWLLAMGVGIGAGVGLAVDGRLEPGTLGLGAIGLAAVGQGLGSPRRLWVGMLVAAVSWTAAWALATG